MSNYWGKRLSLLMHSPARGSVKAVSLKRLLLRHELLPPLKYLCRVVIRNCIVDRNQLASLPLPKKIIEYLDDPRYLVPPSVRL
ncbi:unnamed protein product [Gongylonema pulchrum]|uniref:SOCS box domain-containing protein n=1 Tax=Gongylonema pulchrum TaxID=637853 RepID=A0A183EA18_9BILA|nr:unnamed protein product [Gongylonema pulchrum]VDN30496.1 unnamed protein product [Gongylonema pulchrum]